MDAQIVVSDMCSLINLVEQMPSMVKMPNVGLIFLLTLAMTLFTGCSGGEDTPAESDPASEEVSNDTNGTDGNETTPDNETTDSDGEDTGGVDGETNSDGEDTGTDDDQASGGDDEETGGEDEQSPDPIGNPVGEPIQIDHNAVKAAVDANLTMHIDGLESALVFLEASNALTNLVEMLLDDDEDDDGEEIGDDDSEDDEPAVDIDLSELRDDILEVLSDRILVESTATLSAEGTELSYAFTPEFFCAPEERGNPKWRRTSSRYDSSSTAECGSMPGSRNHTRTTGVAASSTRAVSTG